MTDRQSVHTVSFRRRDSVAKSFKISSVPGVMSRCDCGSSREASPVSATRLVQTDKDDLTHEQQLRWSHSHTGVQQTRELPNTDYFELVLFARRNLRIYFVIKQAYSDSYTQYLMRIGFVSMG